jgi:small subunit ribosomal protein S21
MLIIKVVRGNLSKALKNYKMKFKKTGLLKELRERKQHSKKSRKKRLQKDKAIHKQKYLNNLDNE